MTTKKAIDILAKHQEKLFALPANHQKFSSWKVQALTFIETFFKEGRNSNEYTVLQAYNYFPGDGDTITADKSKSYLSWFIGDCIQTISSIGVYNPPKKNFLYTVDNRWLIPIVVGVCAGMFTLGVGYGKVTSDVQNIELRRQVEELKKSTPKAVSPTLVVPDNKADSNGKNNETDTQPKNSHNNSDSIK